MFGLHMGSMGSAGGANPLTLALLAIFRRPGLESHAYIPGIGWVNGLSLTNTIMEDGTQAASVDNPMGYMGDPIATVGPELVTNGDFSVDANWTKGTGWTISGGVATHAAGATSELTQSLSLTAGRSYQITYTISGYSGSGGVSPRFNGGTVASASALTANGTYTQIITAVTGNNTLAFNVVSTAALSIDNVSVRELVGAIPARQATTANKPILRRGAVNRLLWSNDYSNAAWTKTNVTASGQTITATNTTHTFYNPVTVVPGMTYTFVFKVRRGTMTDLKYRVYNQTGLADIIAPTSYYSQTNSSDFSFVRVVFTAPAGCVTARVYPLSDSGVTGTVLLDGAGVFTGDVQINEIPLTNTAAASSPAGPYWAEFDGTDFLSLAAVPFGMADDHCIVAAANFAGFGVGRCLYGQGVSGGATQSVPFFGVNSTGQLSYYVAGGGVTTNTASAGSLLVAGQTYVVSAVVRSLAVRARSNGVAVGLSPTLSGTYNSAATANIGANGRSTNGELMIGSIYPVIVIKGTVTDAELAILERFVAQASGVQL